MNAKQYEFVNFDQVRDAILKLSDETNNLTLHERGGSTEVQRGQCTLDESLQKYIQEVVEQGPADDIDPETLVSEDDDDDDESDENGSAVQIGGSGSFRAPHRPELAQLQYNHELILKAAIRWLEERSCLVAANHSRVKLRVKAWGVKASKLLFSATFYVHNRAFDPKLEQPAATELEAERATRRDGDFRSPPASSLVPALPQSAPTPPTHLIYPVGYQDGQLYGTKQAYDSLTEMYSRYGNVVMEGVLRLYNMMSDVLEDRGNDLKEGRLQFNQLTEALLEHRVSELKARETAIGIEADVQKNALVREAVTQIGSTARAIFVSKGLSPDVADVLAVLGNNEDLMSALKEPAVRVMLQAPENQAVLGAALRGLAGQHQALQSGEQSQPPSQEASAKSAGSGGFQGQPAEQFPAGGTVTPPPSMPQGAPYYQPSPSYYNGPPNYNGSAYYNGSPYYNGPPNYTGSPNYNGQGGGVSTGSPAPYLGDPSGNMQSYGGVTGARQYPPWAAHPGAAQPTVHQPTVHQPTVHQPTVHQPTVHQPTVHQPTVHQPTVHQPTVHQPSAAQPAAQAPPPYWHGQAATTPSYHPGYAMPWNGQGSPNPNWGQGAGNPGWNQGAGNPNWNQGAGNPAWSQEAAPSGWGQNPMNPGWGQVPQPPGQPHWMTPAGQGPDPQSAVAFRAPVASSQGPTSQASLHSEITHQATVAPPPMAGGEERKST